MLVEGESFLTGRIGLEEREHYCTTVGETFALCVLVICS